MLHNIRVYSRTPSKFIFLQNDLRGSITSPEVLKRYRTKNERFFKGDFKKLLLDSKLITPVRFEKYTYKIVEFGDYVQVYYYKNPRVRNNLEKFDIDDLRKKKIRSISGKIESRNIIRSKLSCQRLAKANYKEWKSFVTLTYKENMQDVKQAKKDLEYFITNIKKVKKDFKYISIPEFQKRGAIHFHLLTNLSVEDNNIIIKQVDNSKYYDVKYWNKGFTSFENISGDIKKIVGYISKYMTEECDDRLFSFRRFSASQNLVKPVESFISMRDKLSRSYFMNAIRNKDLIYSNIYYDNFDNEVQFMEFLKG